MSGNNEGYIIDKLRASNSIAGGGGDFQALFS